MVQTSALGGPLVHGFFNPVTGRIVLYNLHEQFSDNELVLSITVRNQMCSQDSPDIRITADFAGENRTVSTSAVGTPNTEIGGVENGGNPLLIVVARFVSLMVFESTSLPSVENQIYVLFEANVDVRANSTLRLFGFSTASGPASTTTFSVTGPSGLLASHGEWDLSSGVLEISTLAGISANDAVFFSFTLVNPSANTPAASVNIGCNRCSFDAAVEVATTEAADGILAVSVEPPACTSGSMDLGSPGPFGPACEYTCAGVRSGRECLCAPGRFGFDCSQQGTLNVTNSVPAMVVEDDEQTMLTAASGTGVTFPAGSVMRTLVVSVASYTVTDLKIHPTQWKLRSVSEVVEPTPPGEPLALPAEVTVAVSMTAVAAEQAQQRTIQLAFLNVSSGMWQTVPSSLDSSTGHVRGPADFLSPWTVMSIDPRRCLPPQFGAQCQRTCQGSLDATSSVCICPSGRFGFECAQQATRNPVHSVNPTPVAAGAAAEVKSPTGAGVSIPEGATTSDITVEVTGYDVEDLSVDPSQSAILKSVSIVLEMKPDGVRFARPVTLSIPVDLTTVAAEQRRGNAVNMAFLNTTTGLWEVLPGSIDQTTGLLRAQTNHFSVWTAMSIVPVDGG
eukprot:995424-Rhodomonas_salina.1